MDVQHIQSNHIVKKPSEIKHKTCDWEWARTSGGQTFALPVAQRPRNRLLFKRRRCTGRFII